MESTRESLKLAVRLVAKMKDCQLLLKLPSPLWVIDSVDNRYDCEWMAEKCWDMATRVFELSATLVGFLIVKKLEKKSDTEQELIKELVKDLDSLWNKTEQDIPGDDEIKASPAD